MDEDVTNGEERGDKSAKAGEGDPPERRRSSLSPKKRPGLRGKPSLDPSLKRLVQLVGKNLVAPDTTSVERHIRRSERIQRKIAEYLTDNVGSAWTDLVELHARAANYAGCASPTAARWIFQLTRAGQAFRLLDAVDHWVLERREG